ncbi:RICIN domain-containing protein [Streptomyces globosus]|uniref:RICIN domain-containing protein n=1 Tax=Streptomyces TaxID=1883 RepID=UPI000F736845|nr:ricin-type beta-trefoil lectin domain protein [Streptomyces sp. WAC05292]RSS80887.1 hypothetical protein EF903_29605 [Streptomyces sp. WAC05292]
MTGKSVRWGGGGLLAALAGLFVLLLSAPASASASADPGVRYTTSFRSAYTYALKPPSGKCLDMQGGGRPAPGKVIQTFDCKTALHQRFTFHQGGDGTFTIGIFGAYCLTPQGGAVPGAPLVVGTGSGCGVFTWRNSPVAGDRWELVEVTSGQCLRDTGRRSPVVLGACGAGESAWRPVFMEVYNYDQFGRAAAAA